MLFQTRVEPYWCEKPGDSRLLGDFNIKTDYLESSADYDTRIMTVKKGVFIIINTGIFKTNTDIYIYIYIYITVNLYYQVICILPEIFR